MIEGLDYSEAPEVWEIQAKKNSDRILSALGVDDASQLQPEVWESKVPQYIADAKTDADYFDSKRSKVVDVLGIIIIIIIILILQ